MHVWTATARGTEEPRTDEQARETTFCGRDREIALPATAGDDHNDRVLPLLVTVIDAWKSGRQCEDNIDECCAFSRIIVCLALRCASDLDGKMREGRQKSLFPSLSFRA